MSRCRILLVSANAEAAPYPVYPLALPVLRAALESAGHEVKQHDVLMASEADLASMIDDFAPELVGISIRNVDSTQSTCTRDYFHGYDRLVRAIRGRTDAPLVLGGSGYSLFPRKILDELGAEYGIVGPGEVALADLAAAVAGGREPAGISGLMKRGESGPKVSPAAGVMPPLMPRHDADAVRHYWNVGGMIGVRSKRGCAQKCTYCTYPLIEGARIVPVDEDVIVDDIAWLHDEFGVDYFFFVDSVFNADSAAEHRLAERIASRVPGILWGAFFTPKGVDEEYLAPLKASGLSHVELGTDTLTPTTLESYGKGFAVEDVIRASNAVSALGIHLAHYVIFGGPGETEQTVREGLQRAEALGKAAIFPTFGMRLYPGTGLYTRAVSEGVIAEGAVGIQPSYYHSPAVEPARITQIVAAFAESHPNWLLPSDVDRCLPGMQRFRKLGKKGPLWEYIAAAGSERQAKIGRPIEDLIPHRAPMVMVDELVSTSPDGCVARKTFRPGDYGLDGETVSEPAIVEFVAQAVAAMQGASARTDEGGARIGFLTAVSNFTFASRAHAGDELTVHATVVKRLGPMTVVGGVVTDGDRRVGEGELMFYVPE